MDIPEIRAGADITSVAEDSQVLQSGSRIPDGKTPVEMAKEIARYFGIKPPLKPSELEKFKIDIKCHYSSPKPGKNACAITENTLVIEGPNNKKLELEWGTQTTVKLKHVLSAFENPNRNNQELKYYLTINEMFNSAQVSTLKSLLGSEMNEEDIRTHEVASVRLSRVKTPHKRGFLERAVTPKYQERWEVFSRDSKKLGVVDKAKRQMPIYIARSGSAPQEIRNDENKLEDLEGFYQELNSIGKAFVDERHKLPDLKIEDRIDQELRELKQKINASESHTEVKKLAQQAVSHLRQQLVSLRLPTIIDRSKGA